MSTVAAVSPALGSAAAAVAAARAEQVAPWTEQYGPETAARLAQAETVADALGYAPSAARSCLGGTTTCLREEHVAVEPLAVREAFTFKRLGELETSLLTSGERRGRGQAAAADFDGLRALAAAAPDALAGWRVRRPAGRWPRPRRAAACLSRVGVLVSPAYE